MWFSCFIQRRKNLGVALIDIGGGSTTIAVFENGELKTTSVLPVGGEHITNDLSIGLRTSTENAEKIKIKHGHAFYDHASEDEVFDVPIIGSDKMQKFNQLQIADIIEARMEEIFLLVAQEIAKLGFKELPGGFVLTGGSANIPGVLELAQTVLAHNVRIASPDYIGVRNPQYMTGVGLIQFAYKNAKIQGRRIGSKVEVEQIKQTVPSEANEVTLKQKTKRQNEEKMSRVKKFFGYFFE